VIQSINNDPILLTAGQSYQQTTFALGEWSVRFLTRVELHGPAKELDKLKGPLAGHSTLV